MIEFLSHLLALWRKWGLISDMPILLPAVIRIDKSLYGQIAPFKTNQWAVLKSNGQFLEKSVILSIYLKNTN